MLEKKPRFQCMIAYGKWIVFQPHEKKLVLKLFELTLDHYIKKAKKSHHIKLQCRWKNLGCKPIYDKKKDDYIARIKRVLESEGR